jgi:hypothetical protein
MDTGPASFVDFLSRVKSNPSLKFIHDDPRYVDLLRRVGLPQ